MKNTYNKKYNENLPKVVNAMRKLYVAAYNVYGWYWLYKIIWVLPFDWENVLLWFFAMAGLYYFILDNRVKLNMQNYHKGAD